jgi:hypothetical protein
LGVAALRLACMLLPFWLLSSLLELLFESLSFETIDDSPSLFNDSCFSFIVSFRIELIVLLMLDADEGCDACAYLPRLACC